MNDTSRRRRPRAKPRGQAPAVAAASARQFAPRAAAAGWLLPLALLALTLVVYLPAWHGGPLWDDAGHLTKASLQPLSGLGRIWFQIGATQQYYPVTHSAFWLMHRLWGDDTLGYHLVTIALHATAAWLVALVLRRLEIPGATLAAVMFAVHPLQVESVAWMAELKNTLSAVFALGAAMVYLRFDITRARRTYALAFGLFVLALFSKSVTATLPGALLIVFWWRRGRLDWPRDVRPLVPFAAVGVAVGALTAWFEQALIGARGDDYHLSLVERAIIAGRAVWFYLGHLVAPVHLTFIYPRWSLNPSSWLSYLPLVGVLALLAAAWRLRHRARAPFAALLYFVVTLGPALGFVNVYPFRYSFVADHFQYLAGLGPIALASAGVVLLAARLRVAHAEPILLALVGLPLAWVSWGLSYQYRDIETLYRATLDKNPACYLCANNLGLLELGSTPPRLDEAAAHFAQAIQANPELPQPHDDLGITLERLGRFREAADQFALVLHLGPDSAEVENNFGSTLQHLGQLDEAATHFSRAIALRPAFAGAHDNLGIVLMRLGRADEALDQYRAVVALEPGAAAPHRHLAAALESRQRLSEALAEYAAAVQLEPRSPDARADLARVELQTRRLDEAVTDYRAALALAPGGGAATADWHNDLGVALATLGRVPEAIAQFEAALAIDPANAHARDNLAAARRRAPGR